VNWKDSEGKNIFQGGFLELDNIGVFDRSAPGCLEQSDLYHLDGNVQRQHNENRAVTGAPESRV
jgi:hypothetical protein